MQLKLGNILFMMVSLELYTWHDELIDFPTVAQTEHVVDSTMEER